MGPRNKNHEKIIAALKSGTDPMQIHKDGLAGRSLIYRLKRELESAPRAKAAAGPKPQRVTRKYRRAKTPSTGEVYLVEQAVLGGDGREIFRTFAPLGMEATVLAAALRQKGIKP